MNISEMHQYFRQYAQQMGMQNVRAILPEQIDILINTSISDTVNQIIKENIGITSDRVITDNSKLGSVNAFRSLYKVKEVNIEDSFNGGGDNNGHIIHIYTEYDDLKALGLMYEDLSKSYLFIVDLAINYHREDRNFTTNYFPIRIIDDCYLADVLNDFILSPRFRSPVAIIHNGNSPQGKNIEGIVLHLYIDKGQYTDNGQSILYNGLKPNKLRLSYIGKPNKVVYNEDNEGESMDCDLPEYMHVDIVKHAVDLYHTALQGSLYAAQQAQQVQQRENIRNNAQPSN